MRGAKQTVTVTFFCQSRNWGRGVVFLDFFHQRNALSSSSQLRLNWCCNTPQWDLDYRDDALLEGHSLNFGLQAVPAATAVTATAPDL